MLRVRVLVHAPVDHHADRRAVLHDENEQQREYQEAEHVQQGLVEHLFEPEQLGRLQAEVTEDGGAGDAPQPDLQILRSLVVGMHQPQRPRIGRQEETAGDQRDAHDDRGVDPGERDQA